MVRTLNELVYEIIELYRPNYVVTDSIDERLVATWIQSVRAKILVQDLNKSMRYPDNHCIQDLGVVEMIPVDSTYLNESTQGKTILASRLDLPSPLHTKYGPTFTRIGPADRLNFGYRILPRERALIAGNGKFNSEEIYAFWDNRKIFLVSKNGIHKQVVFIQVSGIFANPIEAWEFAHPGETYSWDYEYPVSEHVVTDMKNMVVQDNLKFILTPFADTKPNSTDGIVLPEQQDET